MLHQLARFTSVAPLVHELGGGEVLDVGSGSRGVAGWLEPDWDVTAVDRSFEDEVALRGPVDAGPRTVRADARELPFGDRSFDVVLALDMLEHVPSPDRARVIGELVRVARRRVIVAAPTGAAALAADRRLAAGLRQRDMEPPVWLAEHEANGFPAREELVGALDAHGPVRVLANENLRWHEWLLRFESRRPGFHLSHASARAIAAGLSSRGLVLHISRLLARAAQGPRRGSAYRTIAVLDLDAPPRGGRAA